MLWRLGQAVAGDSPNRKWRRISLKTLETELEMAGPAPPMILTPAGWRPQNVRMTLNGVAAC